MHRDGSNVGAPDVDRLCDEVERRLGSTVGNRRPRRRFLETVDGGHERRDGHPLGVLGLVEQRLRGVEESRGRDGVDEQDMHEVGWVNRLETALGTRDARVGDDDVELADALGLDLADGVGGVRRRGGFDLDEDEARARGRSDGPQVLSCGGVEVADTADDDVVGASEERCQESTAETCAMLDEVALSMPGLTRRDLPRPAPVMRTFVVEDIVCWRGTVKNGSRGSLIAMCYLLRRVVMIASLRTPHTKPMSSCDTYISILCYPDASACRFTHGAHARRDRRCAVYVSSLLINDAAAKPRKHSPCPKPVAPPSQQEVSPAESSGRNESSAMQGHRSLCSISARSTTGLRLEIA